MRPASTHPTPTCAEPTGHPASRPFPAALLATLAAGLGLFGPMAPANAAPSACPGHFYAGAAPDLDNPTLAVGARDLCFLAFAVGHSAQTRTPLWSAEHLTRDGVRAARALPREGEFHDEPALPADEAADLGDYRRSGYDRGHMSPNGDMPTAEAQQQSFSLANMVPQAPQLNRRLWAEIEGATRAWAIRAGELYVVTGPVFQGESLQALNGRVLVPTLIYKAVYDPGRDRAGVYLVRNADDSGYAAISVDQLTQLTGIDIFPGIPSSVKAQVTDLPAPIPRGLHSSGRNRERGQAATSAPAELFGEGTRETSR